MLCIGHSHLFCVQSAAAAQGIAIDAVNFWERSDWLKELPDLPAGLQRRLREHPGTVYSFVGGAAHSVLGLLAHPRRYDLVLPEMPGLPLDTKAEVLPVDAVRAILSREIQPYLKLMKHLRALAQYRVVHLESPPPCSDARIVGLARLIMENLMENPLTPRAGCLPSTGWFARLRRRVALRLRPSGGPDDIASTILHYKLWRVHSEIVAGFCAESGIEFISHPGETTDAHGFIRREFVQDGVHANSRYGALLLEQMQELA